MNLNYQLTFGKFKGFTLQEIADKNSWYLDHILRNVIWLKNKMLKEMCKEDITYIQTAYNKYWNERTKRINNKIVSSYFPSNGWNKDDYSNYYGINGEF